MYYNVGENLVKSAAIKMTWIIYRGDNIINKLDMIILLNDAFK